MTCRELNSRLRQRNQHIPHRNHHWAICKCCHRHWGRTSPGEKLTILFVDDDPFQALVYTAALEGRFHQVLRVADAVEALCLVEDPKVAAHLDLVISAHHRPGMSGPDFVSELHRRLPSIPVLVMGAYMDLVEDYPATGGLVVFLRKPVTVRKLLETVRKILARGFRNVA